MKRNLVRPVAVILILILFCVMIPNQILADSSVRVPNQEMLNMAKEYNRKVGGQTLVVMHQGKIILEDYANGGKKEKMMMLASGTKSFNGIVALAAIEDGIITLDEKVCDSLTEWKNDPLKSQITYLHLLTLTSGLDPGPTDGKSKNLTWNQIIQLPMKGIPGKQFVYGSTHFNTFGEALQRWLLTFYGETYEQYLKRRILDPLGIKVFWGMRCEDGNPQLAGGAYMTAMDWAKFGEWVRNKGVLNHQPIIKSDLFSWLTQGSEKNPAYGLTWWLKEPVSEEHIRNIPLLQGDMGDIANSEWVPEDLFMAAGAGKQLLYIIPSLDLIVVRQAPLGNEKYYHDIEFLSLLLRGQKNDEKGTKEVTLNAVLMTSGNESYIDPEIYSDGNKMVYQTGNGDVYLADIDPITGLFATPNGKDLLIDRGAAKLLQTFNGPEFGIDKNCWSVFYGKNNGSTSQIWRAVINNNQVKREPLTTGTLPRLSILATKNILADSIKLLYSKGPSLKNGNMAWTDEDQPMNETVIDSTDKGVRWIDRTNKFFYIKQTGEKKGQLFLYDTDSKTDQQTTNDSMTKSYSYGWFAPEYNHELVALVLLDNASKIGIYRNTGKEFWEIVKEILIPDLAKYDQFASPEPFVAGGKSYISCAIKQDSDSYSNSEIWILNIQEGKNSTYQRKMEDGLGDAIRSDPEWYLGINEVFIYYNVISQNKFHIYRASTGLITLEDDAMDVKMIEPRVTDASIDGHNEPHYCLLNQSAKKLNKLLLFFPGTNARPYDYLKFGKTAADMGYHVINLSYENNESINIDICKQTKDLTCHYRARYEIWFGEDRHDKISINYPNSIINRVRKLLIYLDTKYPYENWKQFLLNQEINWPLIVTAGHSQGGGHAGFGSKFYPVDKVIMIAATDWVLGKTADWIRMQGQTESKKYYGFIHTLDLPIYKTMHTTWRDYGMLQYGIPVDTDSEPYPYQNSHALTTSLPLTQGVTGHNFIIVDFETPTREDFSDYVYSGVWRYLLEYDANS